MGEEKTLPINHSGGNTESTRIQHTVSAAARSVFVLGKPTMAHPRRQSRGIIRRTGKSIADTEKKRRKGTTTMPKKKSSKISQSWKPINERSISRYYQERAILREEIKLRPERRRVISSGPINVSKTFRRVLQEGPSEKALWESQEVNVVPVRRSRTGIGRAMGLLHGGEKESKSNPNPLKGSPPRRGDVACGSTQQVLEMQSRRRKRKDPSHRAHESRELQKRTWSRSQRGFVLEAGGGGGGRRV